MRSASWITRLALGSSLLLAVSVPANAFADGDGRADRRGLITAVAPDEVKPGVVVVAKGERLGKKFVADLYLTNGKDDIRVDMVKQTDGEITFKTPADLKGRYRLMILTAEIEPKFVEQPFRILIE